MQRFSAARALSPTPSLLRSQLKVSAKSEKCSIRQPILVPSHLLVPDSLEFHAESRIGFVRVSPRTGKSFRNQKHRDSELRRARVDNRDGCRTLGIRSIESSRAARPYDPNLGRRINSDIKSRARADNRYGVIGRLSGFRWRHGGRGLEVRQRLR